MSPYLSDLKKQTQQGVHQRDLFINYLEKIVSVERKELQKCVNQEEKLLSKLNEITKEEENKQIAIYSILKNKENVTKNINRNLNQICQNNENFMNLSKKLQISHQKIVENDLSKVKNNINLRKLQIIQNLKSITYETYKQDKRQQFQQNLKNTRNFIDF